MKFKRCENTEVTFDLECTHDPFIQVLVSFYTEEKIVSYICKKLNSCYSAIVNLPSEFDGAVFKIEARYNSQLVSLFKTKVEFEDAILPIEVNTPETPTEIAIDEPPKPNIISINLLKSINAEVEKSEKSKEFVKSIVQLADAKEPKKQPIEDDILRFFNDLFKS